MVECEREVKRLRAAGKRRGAYVVLFHSAVVELFQVSQRTAADLGIAEQSDRA